MEVPLPKRLSTVGRNKFAVPPIFAAVLPLRSARTYTRQPICVPLRAPDYSADNAGFQRSVPRSELPPRKNIVSTPLVQVGRKIPVVDGLASRTPCRKPQINSRARTELRRDNLPPEPDCALVRRGPHHALCGDERWRFATNHQPITGSDCSGAH